MTIRDLLKFGEAQLCNAQVAEASIDAWLLLEFVTGIDRTHYFLCQNEECEEMQKERYETLITLRAKHVPLQHLTGIQEFMGYPFRVNEDVLIPRQDTELLVQEAQKRIRETDRVLDVCTGSGCIIISLAKLCRANSFTGIDISEKALEVAEQNKKELQAPVTFFKSDLFEQVEGTFECIVSNPPYIRTEEVFRLMPEVRDFEPHLALDGKEDGLFFYRKIIKEAKKYLAGNGWLLFEIGHDQRADVMALMQEEGYVQIEAKKDLAGLDRVVLGQLPEA